MKNYNSTRMKLYGQYKDFLQVAHGQVVAVTMRDFLSCGYIFRIQFNMKNKVKRIVFEALI